MEDPVAPAHVHAQGLRDPGNSGNGEQAIAKQYYYCLAMTCSPMPPSSLLISQLYMNPLTPNTSRARRMLLALCSLCLVACVPLVPEYAYSVVPRS